MRRQSGARCPSANWWRCASLIIDNRHHPYDKLGDHPEWREPGSLEFHPNFPAALPEIKDAGTIGQKTVQLSSKIRTEAIIGVGHW